MLPERRRSLLGSSAAGRELARGLVVQRTVRAEVVVTMPPSLGQLAGITEGLKLFDGQELISKAAEETLCVTVIPRTAWLNVQRSDTKRIVRNTQVAEFNLVVFR